MKYGSVCSGIEAATVAWHPLGWQPAWFAEIEPFPSAVLAHHYPDVINLGDMTAIAARIMTGEIEAPDILVGGTPCQAFSVAGMREGLADPRGELTIRYVELADAIDNVRQQRGEQPAIIVWENVPGVLSSKDNAFGCFLGALAGESCELQPPGGKWKNAGCVFGPQRAVAWRVLDAQYFGLAQRRRRVFVVASARDGFDPAAVLFEREGVRRDTPPRREEWQEPAGTLAARTEGGGFPGTDEACSGYVQPVGCWWDGGQVSQTLDAVLAKGQTMPEKNRFPAVLQPIVVHGTQDPDIRIDQAHTLGRNSGQESAVMYPIQNATRGKDQNGLGVGASSDPMYTLDQGSQHAVCVTGQITHTLKADGFDGSEDGTGRGQPIVATAFTTEQTPKFSADCALTLTKQSPTGGGQIQSVMVGISVRRLMPVEAERLQGFPDGWTDAPYRKKSAADSPRYKAIGNSMAVPCMRWIGERINAVDRVLRGLN